MTTSFRIEKARIAQAFSQAANTYELAAIAQKTIASRLAEKVATLGLPPQPRVLEIGCGTGMLSRLLLQRISMGEWVLSDLSPVMIQHCKHEIADPRVRWHIMDGESPDLPSRSFDLIVSSLAFQWFADLPGALQRLRTLLSPGGYLIFTTLGRDSFIEWRRAHQTLGLSCGLRVFPSALPACVSTEEERLHFTQHNALTFARNFKEIGAQTPTADHTPLSPAQFRALSRLLGADFTVTYHVLFGHYREQRPGNISAGTAENPAPSSKATGI